MDHGILGISSEIGQERLIIDHSWRSRAFLWLKLSYKPRPIIIKFK